MIRDLGARPVGRKTVRYTYLRLALQQETFKLVCKRYYANLGTNTNTSTTSKTSPSSPPPLSISHPSGIRTMRHRTLIRTRNNTYNVNKVPNFNLLPFSVLLFIYFHSLFYMDRRKRLDFRINILIEERIVRLDAVVIK